MLEIKNLTKVYISSSKNKKKGETGRKVAVNNLSLTVKKGEIFGLLGPNGAGKTTTLRCIATLIEPTEGDVLVDGLSVSSDGSKVREKIGFLTNEIKLDDHFTAIWTMRFFGRMRGMAPEKIESRIDDLFSEFAMNDFRDKKVGELSTGMKQKLSVAVSLLHDPEVVIFDEPTNGLDIITAKAVTDYLLKLKDDGKTIIISTHIMDVARKLTDRMAIILEGELRVLGTLEEILERTGKDDLESAFFALHGEV